MKIIDDCLTNSADLISAGDKCVESQPAIAFHLYALALEEVGKSAILKTMFMAEEKSDPDLSLYKNALDDHVKKAFWAIWSASLGSEKYSKERFEEYRGMASLIHERRLASLYVPVDGTEILKMSVEEVKRFRSLVEDRKKIEATQGEIDYSPERIELTTWFEAINQDLDARKLIWSEKAQDKLVELKSVRSWVLWLKEQFDQATKESEEITKRELNRGKPTPEEGVKKK